MQVQSQHQTFGHPLLLHPLLPHYSLRHHRHRHLHRHPVVVPKIIIEEDQLTPVRSISYLMKCYNGSLVLLTIPPNELIIEFIKFKHWSHV